MNFSGNLREVSNPKSTLQVPTNAPPQIRDLLQCDWWDWRKYQEGVEPIADLENRSNWRLLKSGPYKPQLGRLFFF